MLEKIIDGCDKLFRKFGIKSLSMDDIARELGMSKKTIYLYVSDKNDLVQKTFTKILAVNKARCTCIKNEKHSPVDEILLISRDISQQMISTNPSVFFDLRKYHSEAWQLFENYSNQFIITQIKENLIDGIKKGDYRKDINVDIISQLYISLLQTISNPELFSNIDYNFSHVYSDMVKYHLYGICTDKGRKHINTILT